MIVCHCKGKTNRDIEAAAARGARTPRDVTEVCDAGSGCGGCVHAINALLLSKRTRRGPAPRGHAKR